MTSENMIKVGKNEESTAVICPGDKVAWFVLLKCIYMQDRKHSQTHMKQAVHFVGITFKPLLRYLNASRGYAVQ